MNGSVLRFLSPRRGLGSFSPVLQHRASDVLGQRFMTTPLLVDSRWG
jgi:hypothetical protein